MAADNTAREPSRDWYRSKFMEVELLISVVASGIVLLASRTHSATTWLAQSLGPSTALYSTLAGLSGTLLGFVITTLALIIALGQGSGRGARIVRDSNQMRAIVRIYFQGILWLSIMTVWSIIGLTLKVHHFFGIWGAYIEFWLCLLVGLRLYRCVWALRNMLQLEQ